MKLQEQAHSVPVCMCIFFNEKINVILKDVCSIIIKGEVYLLPTHCRLEFHMLLHWYDTNDCSYWLKEQRLMKC